MPVPMSVYAASLAAGKLKTYTFVAAPLSVRLHPEAHSAQGHKFYPYAPNPYDFEVCL